MAAAKPNGDEIVVRGTWEGTLLESPHGDNGFGYDPIFFDPTANKSGAELTRDEKNARSHRGNALRALLARWAEFMRYGATRANAADGTNRPQISHGCKAKKSGAGGATRRFSFTPAARPRVAPSCLCAERPTSTVGTGHHFYASRGSRHPHLPLSTRRQSLNFFAFAPLK